MLLLQSQACYFATFISLHVVSIVAILSTAIYHPFFKKPLLGGNLLSVAILEMVIYHLIELKLYDKPHFDPLT